MTKQRHIPWIVCDQGHDNMAGTLRCHRCGITQDVPSPIDVDLFIALGKAFEKKHRRCRERLAEAPR